MPMVCPRCGKIYPVAKDATRAWCGQDMALLLPTDEPYVPLPQGPGGKKRMVPSPGEQARILEQQARCCIYCDRPFGGDVRVTWDHFVPWSYSQRNEKFVAACQRCNSKKSDKMFQTLEEARAYLESVLHKV